MVVKICTHFLKIIRQTGQAWVKYSQSPGAIFPCPSAPDLSCTSPALTQFMMVVSSNCSSLPSKANLLVIMSEACAVVRDAINKTTPRPRTLDGKWALLSLSLSGLSSPWWSWCSGL